MTVLQKIASLPRRIKKLSRHYLVITKATPFIFGIIVSHSLAEYTVVGVLMNHLTETWEQSVAKAAIIVNMVEGMTGVFMLLAHVSHIYVECFHPFRGALCFYTIFIFGLLLTRFLPEHLGSESITELYVGLAFVTLGRAGETSLTLLIFDQLHALEENKNREQEQIDSQSQRIKDRLDMWWYCPWFIGAVVAIFWGSEWIVYTLVSAIVMAITLLWFSLGQIFHFYQHFPVTNPLTKVYYVLKGAILKRHQQYPESPDGFLNNEKHHLPLLPDHPFLRWVDKAAIINRNSTPSTNNVQREEETEVIEVVVVEELKFFFMMVPMWSMLLIYGLVEAMGSTFFLEQAQSIDGDFQVIIFMIIKSVTSIVAPLLWPDRVWGSRRSMMLLKIGVGMMCSLICCAVAYIVQVFYLRNGINIFWLTPQFMFLGLTKGLVETGIDDLFRDQVSEAMTTYGTTIIEFIKGIAKFICALLILCFESWFDDDLGDGRLDKFYGLLGIFAAGNLLLYRLVIKTYEEQQPQTKDNVVAESQNIQSYLPITIHPSQLQRNQSLRQRSLKNNNATENISGNHAGPAKEGLLKEMREGLRVLSEESVGQQPSIDNVSIVETSGLVQETIDEECEE